MGVDLHLTLSGPSPWEATGTATFQVFIFSASVSFDVTIGSALPPAAPPPLPDLSAMLANAFKNLGSWSAIMPADSKTAVAVRPRSAAGQVFVHPLGDLSAHQRVVPIGLSINNYGTIPLPTPITFSLKVTIEGAADFGEQPIKDFFAPAQFQQLSDSQKLARPSFEQYQSGVRFGSSTATAGSTRQSAIGYKTELVDPGAKAPAMARAAAAATSPDYQVPGSSLDSQIPTGAAARAKGNTTGSAKYAGVPRPVAAAQTTYVLAGAGDLLMPPGSIAPSTYSQAIDLLRSARNPDLQIVVSHEPRRKTDTKLTSGTFDTGPFVDIAKLQWISSTSHLKISPIKPLKALYYRSYPSTPTPPTYIAAPVTGLTISFSGPDGACQVDWFGVDLQGEEETPQSQSVQLDNTPPPQVTLSLPTPIPGWRAGDGECVRRR